MGERKYLRPPPRFKDVFIQLDVDAFEGSFLDRTRYLARHLTIQSATMHTFAFCNFVNKLLFLFVFAIITERQHGNISPLLCDLQKGLYQVKAAPLQSTGGVRGGSHPALLSYILYVDLHVIRYVFFFYRLNLTPFARPSLSSHSIASEGIIWPEIIARLVVSTLCCMYAPLPGETHWQMKSAKEGYRMEEW